MAGTPVKTARKKGLPTPARKPNQRTRRRTEVNRETLGVALAEARHAGIQRPAYDCSSGELLQILLERYRDQWAKARAAADELRPGTGDYGYEYVRTYNRHGDPTGVSINPKIREEYRCAQDVERLATKMEQLGIADRLVKVEESKIQIVINLFRSACRDAGLTREQERSVVRSMQQNVIEGTAT